MRKYGSGQAPYCDQVSSPFSSDEDENYSKWCLSYNRKVHIIFKILISQEFKQTPRDAVTLTKINTKDNELVQLESTRCGFSSVYQFRNHIFRIQIFMKFFSSVGGSNPFPF